MEAKFFDGRSAIRHTVNVDILSDRVAFRKSKEDGHYDWFFRDLEAEKISETVMIVRNRLIPDARLEVEGSSAVHALQKKLRFRPSVMWTEDTRILAWIIGAFLMVILMVYLSMDLIAEKIVTYVPRDVEKKIFGDYERLLGVEVCKDLGPNEIVDKILKRLTTEEEYKEFKVVLVNNKTVNAFAVPGGVILVHSELIKEIHHSDELAGVLAHELEHQSQRHIAKSLVKSSLLSLIGALVAGGRVGDLAATLTQLKFSRETEALADKGGAERLDRAGISRMGMVNFLKRLSKMASLPEILSTHPLAGREDQLLDNYDVNKKLPPSLSDLEFKTLKSLKCSSR